MEQDTSRAYFFERDANGALSIVDIIEADMSLSEFAAWVRLHWGPIHRGKLVCYAAGYRCEDGTSFFPWDAKRLGTASVF